MEELRAGAAVAAAMDVPLSEYARCAASHAAVVRDRAARRRMWERAVCIVIAERVGAARRQRIVLVALQSNATPPRAVAHTPPHTAIDNRS